MAAGGLHVIGTAHHEAARIDNQLRGRAGRQGDPGSSQFIVSLDDELWKKFGRMEIEELRDLCGEHDTIIWGGIPGAMFSPPWTGEQVRENTIQLLDELAPDNRLVVGSADQVPPDGDIDFCRLIADTIAEWAGA